MGTEISTQETQQDSVLALEAADITENIELRCQTCSLKWKLERGHSHALTLTHFLLLVPVYVFAYFLTRLHTSWDSVYTLRLCFQHLKVNLALNQLP